MNAFSCLGRQLWLRALRTGAGPSWQARISKVFQLPAEYFVFSLLGFMLGVGLVLRFQGLDAANHFTFDEELFVRNAHRYLLGSADDNDHPPLGKLLQAVGLLLFGYNPLGWRFAAACFGIHTVWLGYWLARTLFKSSLAGFLAAAFLMLDGFFIAYSRAGLLDGILCCFVFWSLLSAAWARTLGGVFSTGLLIGLAMSIKWSAALIVIPVVVTLVVLQRVRLVWLLALAVAPMLHAGLWTWALWLTHQPHDPSALFQLMQRLFRHHLELGSQHNPLASPWYSWIVLYHPIVVKLSSYGLESRYAAGIGNPLLWLAGSTLSVGFWFCFCLRGLLPKRRLRRMKLLAWLRLEPHTLAAGLVLALAWLCLILPWVVARGSYTFMYHYLPSYGFALIGVAGALATIERKRPRLVLCFLLATVSCAAYFVPVWGEFLITERTANARLLFATWRP